jgi:septum site-determining protein MinC
MPEPAPGLSGADTMMLRKTLRSGQRVQFSGNVVVIGDVNAGAEIEAGGDVVVLGNLRGTVHAGSGGRQDAVVVALNLHASQVRIGDLIGFVGTQKGFQQNAAVMARVQDGAVATCMYGS